MELGMKFHATDLDEMQVVYEEDTWLIKGLNSMKLSLWHNNYVKTSETERYITDGFHNQNVGDKKDLQQILQYIEGYSWQVHLEHEKEKENQRTKEAVTEKRKVMEEDKVTKTKKWYRFIVEWIHKLVGKKIY
jgi:hypothetical protein